MKRKSTNSNKIKTQEADEIIILKQMPGGSSDKTLKKEIKNITGGLHIIKNLL